MPPKTPHMEVTSTTPKNHIKEKLEDISIRDVFTEDSIASADSLIEEKKKDFFGDAKFLLDEMETAYTQLANDSGNPSQVRALESHCRSLRGQSETLGFDLLAHISKSLLDFCSKHYKAGDNDKNIVLRKHLDTLQLIIRDKMQGDGGAVGKELINSLQLLNKKFA